MSGGEIFTSSAYNSEEVFAKETQTLFFNNWLCVGRLHDLETAGGHLCLEVYGEVVLVVSDSESVQAFSAACLHKGAIVEEVVRGGTKEFQCPYHGWRYKLDGTLKFRPLEASFTEPLCPDARLKRFGCAVWLGWIFVNLSGIADMPQFMLSNLTEQLATWKIDRMKPVMEPIEFMGSFNWKLLCENVGDSYHIPHTHANTLLGADYKNVEWVVDENSYLKTSHKSFSDHKVGMFGELSKTLPKDFSQSWALVVFPFHIFTVALDFVVWQHVQPISPAQTKTTFHLLAHQSTTEAIEAVRESICSVWMEDQMMFESVQRGSRSEFFTTSEEYASSLEYGSSVFRKWWRRSMKW